MSCLHLKFTEACNPLFGQRVNAFGSLVRTEHKLFCENGSRMFALHGKLVVL